MKKYLCEQSYIIGKTLSNDLEALTSNSGSTCMTLGQSLNLSLSSPFHLCLFSYKVEVLDQINGFLLCSMELTRGLLNWLGSVG